MCVLTKPVEGSFQTWFCFALTYSGASWKRRKLEVVYFYDLVTAVEGCYLASEMQQWDVCKMFNFSYAIIYQKGQFTRLLMCLESTELSNWPRHCYWCPLLCIKYCCCYIHWVKQIAAFMNRLLLWSGWNGASTLSIFITLEVLFIFFFHLQSYRAGRCVSVGKAVKMQKLSVLHVFLSYLILHYFFFFSLNLSGI